MNRFHVIFYVRFVFVLFSTTRASEQPCLSISFNVLLQYNPVCSWKKHLHLVSGKERVFKVAGRKFFKMSLDVLAHIVSVIVGQRLPADSATEYSFFVSVNHRLDKGIHTWRKTFDQQHVGKVAFNLLSGMLDCSVRFVISWIVDGATVACFERLLAPFHLAVVSDGHVRLNVVLHVVPRAHHFLANGASEFGRPTVVLLPWDHATDERIQV